MTLVANVILCVMFCCLVGVGFVMMCETYSKQKKELTKAEHKEILEYARSRYVYSLYIYYVAFIHAYT